MPEFSCDFATIGRSFDHCWEHTVGSGHAPLALRADWQAQLRQCHRELGFRHIRFHALLSDQMETLICEENKFLYSFFNADQIIDFLLSIGMRPFVELSFMPRALASGRKTVFRYKANVTPPKSYGQWSKLITTIVSHWVDRYGLAEVQKWFFEVWNEPNLHSFWTGTQKDYFHLYQVTAAAIKSVDASLRVGGPATAKNAWIPEFLDFCTRKKVPVDFITTHHYPTDAFGKIGADTLTQLQRMPRGKMRADIMKVRSEAQGIPVYYTEWNTSSNPRDRLHDEPFTAAFAAKTIMEAAGLVAGYSFWTFSDIFAENYFPVLPFQGGFGLLTIHGIAKPVYRAFELLHRLGNEIIPVEGNHKTVDAWVVRRKGGATILSTNHAMPRHPIRAEHVKMRITNTLRPKSIYVQRIDEDHSNPRQLWHAMGQPQYLSAVQVEKLKAASLPTGEPLPWRYENGHLDIAFTIPPQGIAALEIKLS